MIDSLCIYIYVCLIFYSWLKVHSRFDILKNVRVYECSGSFKCFYMSREDSIQNISLWVHTDVVIWKLNLWVISCIVTYIKKGQTYYFFARNLHHLPIIYTQSNIDTYATQSCFTATQIYWLCYMQVCTFATQVPHFFFY